MDKVMQLIEAHCESSLGLEYVKQIKLYTEFDYIDRLLKETADFKHLLESGLDFPSLSVNDLTASLRFLKIEDAVLNETQVFQLLKNLLIVMEIKIFFEQQKGTLKNSYAHVYAIFKDLELDKAVINRIRGVVDDEGKIRSSASRKLALIRNQVQQKYREIESQFKQIISHYRKKGWLTEEGETVRNGRRVLALQSEFKRSARGIIADESVSGKVTFMEPDETLHLNNELFELQQEEKREIYRILKTLCTEIRPFADHFFAHQEILAYGDFVQAKSKLAIEMQAEMPQLSGERIIELHKAYHPLLFLLHKKNRKDTVSLSLRLSIAQRILVISGPNAGGKSVALKTVGLLQVMLQAGLLVPVNPVSIMGIFHTIALDMGDEQSLENDLSTYSSRLKNMRWFAEMADHKTLVLIDEFGSGTDPKFGGAIAEAMLEYLNNKFVFGVITTHYSNIKLFASETKGIINGAMCFDHKNLQPLYILETGKPGSSFAFELAQKINLPENILEAAREKVGAEYRDFDHLLGTLHLEKSELLGREKNLREAEEKYATEKSKFLAEQDEWNKSRKIILLEAKEKSLQAISDTNRRMENVLRELRENYLKKEKMASVRAEMEAEKADLLREVTALRSEITVKSACHSFIPGDQVKLQNADQRGEIISVQDGKALVQFGLIKSRIPLKELELLTKTSPSLPPTRSYHDSFKTQLGFQYTLDVRGKRREEALLEVEAWLDRALMLNADQLKIIHGRGNGVLKRAIRDNFRNFPSVKSIHDEDPQYGGDSISIIELG